MTSLAVGFPSLNRPPGHFHYNGQTTVNKLLLPSCRMCGCQSKAPLCQPGLIHGDKQTVSPPGNKKPTNRCRRMVGG